MHARKPSEREVVVKPDTDEVVISSRPSSSLGKASDLSNLDKYAYAKIKLIVRVRPLLQGEKDHTKTRAKTI